MAIEQEKIPAVSMRPYPEMAYNRMFMQRPLNQMLREENRLVIT